MGVTPKNSLNLKSIAIQASNKILQLLMIKQHSYMGVIQKTLTARSVEMEHENRDLNKKAGCAKTICPLNYLL